MSAKGPIIMTVTSACVLPLARPSIHRRQRGRVTSIAGPWFVYLAGSRALRRLLAPSFWDLYLPFAWTGQRSASSLTHTVVKQPPGFPVAGPCILSPGLGSAMALLPGDGKMREHAVPDRLRRRSVRPPCGSACKVLALTGGIPGSIRRGSRRNGMLG